MTTTVVEGYVTDDNATIEVVQEGTNYYLRCDVCPVASEGSRAEVIGDANAHLEWHNNSR